MGHVALQVFFFDTTGSFPAVGSDTILYVDRSGGGLYRWNGSAYVAVGGTAPSGSSGGVAGGIPVYLTNLTSSTLGTYKQMSYTNDVSATTLGATVTAGEALVQTYVFDTALGVTSIPAGVWSCNFNAQVSTAAGVSTIRVEYYARTSGGVETLLFSKSSDEINATSYADLAFRATEQDFVVNATDKLVMKVYVATTHNAPVTVNYRIGNGTSSWFTTPFPLRHSLLRELDWASSKHTGTAGTLAGFDATRAAAYITPSGDATMSATGVVTLKNSGVTAGSYTSANITVDSKGRITAASNGSGGGGGSAFEATVQDYKGLAMVGILGQFDATTAKTLAEVTIISDSLPVGSNLICELRKNSTSSGNILSSTLQVTTTESATNGRYVGTPVTSFTSAAIADGDVLYAVLTGVGSTTPAINARVILRFSA